MAAEALKALNSLIAYQQQSEKQQLQQSLALMQFAQAKRANDISIFEKQISYADKSNKQMTLDAADQFLRSSGLQYIADITPTGLDDPDEIKESLTDLSEMLYKKRKGFVGKDSAFTPEKASEIASAIWAWKNAQEPRGIINLATQLDRTVTSLANDGNVSKADKKNFLAYKAIGSPDIKEASRLATRTEQAQRDILKEMIQFSQGDTEIQSDFGLLSPEVVEEFQSSQQNIVSPQFDLDALANLILKDLSEDTKESAFNLNYNPPKNNFLLRQVSYLPQQTQQSEAERLKSITAEQDSLSLLMHEAIEERDELLSQHADLKEERDKQNKIFKYHREMGNDKEWKEALQKMRDLDVELGKKSGYSNVDSPAHEAEAYRLANTWGRNWVGAPQAQSYSESHTNKVFELKEAIQALERERTKFL